jgi:hypothetical protein
MQFKFSIIVMCLLLGVCTYSGEAVNSTGGNFWVALNGNDANPGTQEKPFASLEKARDEIRRLKVEKGLPKGGVTVYLRGGTYQRKATFALESQDSGTEGAPLVYRSAPGERAILSGGVSLPTSAFKPVTDPAILSRLPEEAQTRVLQADLKPFGISGLGDIKSHADFRISPLRTPAPELFVNKEAMTLARWPNSDYTSSSEVGPQRQPARRWAQATDIWLMLQKAYSRDSKPVELAKIGSEGIQKGKWIGGCYYYNLLEEIDMPGEYFVDRVSGTLYLYPAAPLKDGDAELSVLATPFVTLENTAYVEFRELVFTTGRDHGVVITGGVHNRVAGCELRNLGKVGVVIGNEDPYWILSDMYKQLSVRDANLLTRPWEDERGAGGTDNGVIGCDIHGTGAGGIALAGGDRPTLTPGNNFAENNHIWNYHRLKGSYGPALNLGGVGLRVSHNLIHGAAHDAIQFNGNDHLMEFNEIFDVLNDTTDAGAVYSGREWTYRGNIFRNNFVHDIGGRGRYYSAIYLDDLLSSLEIDGNIFAELQDGCLAINGGRDNKITNNVFVNIPRAINMADYRTTPGRWGLPKSTLRRAPFYRNAIWSKRYPELARILDDEPGAAKGNVVERNLFFNANFQVPVAPYISLKNNLWLCPDQESLAKDKVSCEKNGYTSANVKLEVGDPKFVNPTARDYQLRPDSPVWALLSGFKPIPMEKIGLLPQGDPQRLRLPPFRLLAPVANSVVNPEQLVFAWAPSSAATRYRLLVSADPEFKTVLVETTTRTPWAVVDLLEYGKSYFWKVEAQTLGRQLQPTWNAGGVVALSTLPQVPPTTPTGVQARARFQKVDLTWNRVPGRATYALYRRTEPTAEFAKVAQGLTAGAHTDLVPEGGKPWEYAVKAVNAAGESALSAPLAVAVSAERPALVKLNLELDREVLRPGGTAVAKLSGLMNDGDPAPAEALAGVRYEIGNPTLLSVDATGKLIVAKELSEAIKTTVRARIGELTSPELTVSLVAIPAPWDVKAFGSKTADASFKDGRFTLRGNGKNVWDTADDFLFVYRWIRPDTAGKEIVLQSTVCSIAAPQNAATAGLMFRETDDAKARNVFLRVQADGVLMLTYRPVFGESSKYKNCGQVTLPAVLKLIRNGKLFTAWHQRDNLWLKLNEIELDLNPGMYAGMGVYSCTDSPMSAVFEEPKVLITDGK